MNINTKYNVGDKVWLMHDNQVKDALVESIHTTTTIEGSFTHSSTETRYYIVSGATRLGKPENQCFRTKQELLESL